MQEPVFNTAHKLWVQALRRGSGTPSGQRLSRSGEEETMSDEICLDVQPWILELSNVQDGVDLERRAAALAGMKGRRRGRSR
jgi:hypothetical protein